MPFNIPDGSGGGTGEYLDRVQYDARVGFWQIARRVQKDGAWEDEKSEPFKQISMLVDFGSIEIGYIRFSSPPSFLLVPLGHQLPPQPEEMAPVKPGEAARRSFLPGFRIKVASPRTFGNGDAHYFAATSKTVRNSVEALFDDFLSRPEAARGLVPVVASDGSAATVIKTKQGTSTYWGPVFSIVNWAERTEAFGERTVGAPAPRQYDARVTAQAAPPPPPPPPPPPAYQPGAHTTAPSAAPGIPQPAFAQHVQYPPPQQTLPAGPPPGHPAAAGVMPDFDRIPY